jgi:tetratricopeptide (TPR) repeat protein
MHGGKIMTGKLKLAVLLSMVCALICGCNQNTASKKPPVKLATPEELNQIEKAVASEQEKKQLLKQLEGKFEDPEAHYKLGKLYQADGMWPKAESEFSTALSFDPVYYEAQAARIKVLFENHDKAKAALLVDEYITQAANSAAGSLKLGIGFQKEGLEEYSLTCYKQALRLAPNSAKVNRQVGYYYLSKNQTEQAKIYLTRSFQLDPTQAEVAGELGRLGVAVQIPRKTDTNTKKVDDIVDKANKTPKP